MQSLRSYLKETGVLTNGDKECIQRAINEYWALYYKKYNQEYWKKYRWIKARLTKDQEEVLKKHLLFFNKKLNADNMVLLAMQAATSEVQIYDTKIIADWMKTANSIGNLLNQWIVIARKTDHVKEDQIIHIKAMLMEWRNRIANELKHIHLPKKEIADSN